MLAGCLGLSSPEDVASVHDRGNTVNEWAGSGGASVGSIGSLLEGRPARMAARQKARALCFPHSREAGASLEGVAQPRVLLLSSQHLLREGQDSVPLRRKRLREGVDECLKRDVSGRHAVNGQE